jgi:hypothetical protein
MSIYEDIESAIVQRLKPLEALPQIIVEPMPENQAGYSRPTADAKIWVVYEGSDLGSVRAPGSELRSIGHGVQEETYSYQVQVMARKLRGTNGLYHLTKLIKSKLIGFEPCGLDKMNMISNRFAPGDDAYKENLFTYILTFATKGLSIEEVADENLPGLVSVSFEENYPT